MGGGVTELGGEADAVGGVSSTSNGIARVFLYS